MGIVHADPQWASRRRRADSRILSWRKSDSRRLCERACAIVDSILLLRLWNRESLAHASNAILLGLLVASAGLLAAATPAGEELEEDFGLSWLFRARGPVAAPIDVVIVAIDEQSSRDLGLPDKPSAWPRALHAELVRYLAKAGAKVVSFDLTFDAPGVKPEQDQEFADAIRSAGNVLLAESIGCPICPSTRAAAGPDRVDPSTNGSALWPAAPEAPARPTQPR